MDLQLISLTEFQTFLICLSRVTAILTAIPVFGSQQIPAQMKIGLIVFTTLLLFPLMAPILADRTFTLQQLALVVIHEVLLGLLLALATNFIFAAIQIGGTIIGYQMGFAAANIFDPQTTDQLPLLSQYFNVFALLIFFAVGAHALYFQIILESYSVLPPGYFDFSGDVFLLLDDLTRKMFILGVKLSAPIIVVLTVISLALGIMARVFPQLNVFMLSFPLNIGVSLLAMGLSLPIIASLLSQEFDSLSERFLHLMSLL